MRRTKTLLFAEAVGRERKGKTVRGSITKSISREARDSTLHELMLTNSGQTIRFHQSDSHRFSLASENRSVAPTGSVARMAASRSSAEGSPDSRSITRTVFCAKAAATQRKNRSPVGEEYFESLSLDPRATRQPITMFRLIASRILRLDPRIRPPCSDRRSPGGATIRERDKGAAREQSTSDDFGLAVSGLDADENLAVLKGDDVGRPCDLHEAAMQFADPPIRNDDDIDVWPAAQPGALLAAHRRHCAAGELFERSSIERDLALPIEDRNLR